MKQYTIIAACMCGCKKVSSHPIRAESMFAAEMKLRKQEDPEWPMRILTTLEGKWETEAR
jgi:uncharacterized protein YceK